MSGSADTPIRTANPRASYHAHKAEIDAAVLSTLEHEIHVLGPPVERFEARFASFVGVEHGIGVNSGTDAIHLALRALGIGPGDEVVTVSHTSVATVASIEMSGATPVLVDVEDRWLTIDPEAAARAVGPRTKAIVAVHLYGQAVDLRSLSDLCDAAGVALVEDCAQAHGTTWMGRPVGSFGVAGCFSFYPSKNLGTVGDGGMVVTNDERLRERIARLRQYGWSAERESLEPGWNSRLGSLEAAILDVKLDHLTAMVAARRAIAERYGDAFADLALALPQERLESRHSYHLYVVRCAERAERDALLQHLAACGVAAGVHYPIPVHLQRAYRGRISARKLSMTEAAADRVLSLPIYPELGQQEQETVVSAVRAFYGAS